MTGSLQENKNPRGRPAGVSEWSGRESNPRPLQCDCSALPTELPPRCDAYSRRPVRADQGLSPVAVDRRLAERVAYRSATSLPADVELCRSGATTVGYQSARPVME